MTAETARAVSPAADQAARELSARAGPFESETCSIGLRANVDSASEPAPAPRRGVWILAAALTCPCHLPVYIALLSASCSSGR